MMSSRTLNWMESLATQEEEIATGDRLSIDLASAKETLLNTETVLLSRALLTEFRALVGFLNRRLPEAALPIRVHGSTEEDDEFVVERKPYRITFRSQPGILRSLCEKNSEMESSGSIEARFSAFYELDWLFLGSKVTPEQIARHYLTELLQLTSTQ